MLRRVAAHKEQLWHIKLVRGFAKHHPPDARPGFYMNGLIDIPYKALPLKYTSYDWTVYPGDEVEIIIGPEKGSRGKVLAVYRDERMPLVIVEGRNLKKKKVREGLDPNDFYVVTAEAPLLYDQVLIVDPVTGKAVKTAIRFTEDGTKVRLTCGSQSSGSIMKIPAPPVDPLKGLPGDKDTKKEDALEQTYQPGEPIPFRIPVVNHGQGKQIVKFYSTQTSNSLPYSCSSYDREFVRWAGLSASALLCSRG